LYGKGLSLTNDIDTIEPYETIIIGGYFCILGQMGKDCILLMIDITFFDPYETILIVVGLLFYWAKEEKKKVVYKRAGQ